MTWIALKMLTGDRSKYLGLIFGVAFATLLMSQQVSIFAGIMRRTASQILDVRDADIWVMDDKVRYIDEVPGLPDTRIWHLSELASLRCPAHHKRMVATAWQLGAPGSIGDLRLRLWAHMLGYGGHFLTKSRRYSVSFGQLRRARADHRRLERHGDDARDPWGRPLDETVVLVLASWSYAGTGYSPRTPGAELALASADMARAR